MNVDIEAIQSRPAKTVSGAVVIGAVAVAFALLCVLHLLQPELSPATSVVSQYALGARGWMMAVVFAALGAACLATAAVLRGQVRGGAGVTGLVLLVVAAIGLVLAALFRAGQSRATHRCRPDRPRHRLPRRNAAALADCSLPRAMGRRGRDDGHPVPGTRCGRMVQPSRRALLRCLDDRCGDDHAATTERPDARRAKRQPQVKITVRLGRVRSAMW
jgi:Protein of unknown function (DUF998)